MGDPRAPRSHSQTWRTSPSSPNARDTERHLLLRAQGRGCLAVAPARLLLAGAESAYHYFRAWRMETEPGSTYTPLYGRGCAVCWVESLPPARRSSTPREPRPPRKEAHEATTVARKSAVEGGICSSTRKVW